MSKAVSLYLPHFATDLVGRLCRARLRAKRRPDRTAILLQATHAGRQVVAACCAQAAAAGVRAGMTMAEARALLPGTGKADVIVEPHDPDRDLQALEALGRWALRFSPLVAADPPDGLLIDIAGCAHLFGGEGGLVDRIAEGAGGLGFAARVAAAPTLACARALARFAAADRLVIPPGGARDALEPLPVAALDVGPKVVAALAEVGVDRIGHLLALRRDEVARRFGTGLLKRLDQALGRVPEAVETIRDDGPPMVECVFAGPVKQLEAIQLTVSRLLEELAATLEKRESGVRKLEVQFDRADAGPCRETLALSRPSRDAKHLRTLLAPRVESMNMGVGVERVSLVAARTGRLPHEQVERWSETTLDEPAREQALGELLDVLSHRLGHRRVLTAEPAESHLPERSVRFHPAEKKIEREGPRRAAEEEKGTVPFFVGDRPALLFSRPEPITVIALTPEGPPVWFRWRSIEQRITASTGPERIAEEWWRGRSDGATKRRSDEGKKHSARDAYARAYAGFMLRRDPEPDDVKPAGTSSLRVSMRRCMTRDYFKVQDEEGRWLWIFRILETGGWYVHGLWA